MFDLSQADLEQLVIHKVGNKMREEGFIVSPGLCRLADANVEELLLKYFLSSFKDKTVYKFSHETDLHLHEVYMYASAIFINKQVFYEQSVNILKHLYEKSSHPQVKGGECYLAYLSGCVVEGQVVDAVGIFKTENKDNYLKVANHGNTFALYAEQGINIKKLDKGCLIFNLESVDGYRIALVDNVNKGNEAAVYWQEEFLHLANVQDEYFHTQHYLDCCHDFATNIYGPLHQADKKDQVVFMNDAVAYFDQNREFTMEGFIQSVVKEPELAAQFREHKEMFDQNQGVPPAESFSISSEAVKTVRRKLKNLIKLDTSIEIRVKTPAESDNAGYIERGYDAQKGMHFYKVFFNAEE
ncbi:Hypothetical protein LUCI_0372 [Lucifera butyrica]|uniref:Nucleoid-associated protein n=2 Tax=Lucifera butyrica TaxID=1351585 RepID=A0A498R1X6_9FIRM|nr:Hypothetical protein LUCI_0372 [Lucifera butyrica]